MSSCSGAYGHVCSACTLLGSAHRDSVRLRYSVRSANPPSRLLKHYDISFVSTGDVLRKEIADKTDVGKRAEEIVRTGGAWMLSAGARTWRRVAKGEGR